tara:strand:- start:911 stop:1690 length:780 start_codon:yes stop_codon:yes gene_type:complete
MAVTEPLDETQVIANLGQITDPSAQYYAAWWLGKMRSRHPKALPLLQKTLKALEQTPVNPDRRGVALNAIRALGRLGNPVACNPLSELLNSTDYTVREEAARSLGRLRSPAAVAGIRWLLESGIEVAGGEQAGSPLLREPCEALIEALGDIGLSSSKTLAVIRPFVDHPRPLIRAAACRALLQLTGESRWGVQLIELLKHPEALVRRGALLDLGATGWTAAGPAISEAAVEPSLKLVALRGLAEHSEDPRILEAMDDLI